MKTVSYIANFKRTTIANVADCKPFGNVPQKSLLVLIVQALLKYRVVYATSGSLASWQLQDRVTPSTPSSFVAQLEI